MMFRTAVSLIAVAISLPACTADREPPTPSAVTPPATTAPAPPLSEPASRLQAQLQSESESRSQSQSQSVESQSQSASNTAPRPSPQPTTSAPAPALPTTFGSGPPWPLAPRSAAPPAYGALVTNRVAGIAGGGTLAAELLLPRLDADVGNLLVMTPCGKRVRLRRSDVRLVPPGAGGPLPKQPADVVALVDPGHGGPQEGAIGTDGSKEKDRVLPLAQDVARRIDARLGRVFLTRSRDFEATLEFRVALGDSLRADVAVAVHLNAEAGGRLDRPGVETYGSVSDPQGRRLAGVMYEAQRRYLQTFPGPWLGDSDAGAKYRLGRRGGDYYGLLRRAHIPWVISESLFMTSAHDIALLDQAEFVSGLAAAVAEGAVLFTTTRTPGSGWVKPDSRPADPQPPRSQDESTSSPGPLPCVDPAR